MKLTFQWGKEHFIVFQEVIATWTKPEESIGALETGRCKQRGQDGSHLDS